jgi:phosphatidylglycerol:prolipoprotein diacylglycerol transferase
MDPVAFTVFGKSVYWYGIMVALSFVAATVHWTLLGRKENRPPNFASDLALILMLAGVLGGRVAYILANVHEYLENPADIIRIDKGGLVFYGGFIGATIAAIVLAHRRKEPLFSLLDFAVTAVPLGHAFGRVGCFINHCCYGTPWDGPLAVCMPNDICRHPVQLYEAAANIAIYLALLKFYPKRTRSGTALAVYLMLYGSWRFVAEFFRGDARLTEAGLHVSQWVSVGMIAVGVALMMLAPRRAASSAAA